MCKCIGGCLVRDFQGIRAEYYKLLPMLCNHESNEIETHLAKDCIFTLGYMAQAILPLSVIPACLQAIHQVSKSGSWKARASVLGFLQVTLPIAMPYTWIYTMGSLTFTYLRLNFGAKHIPSLKIRFLVFGICPRIAPGTSCRTLSKYKMGSQIFMN